MKENKWIGCTISGILSLIMSILLILAFLQGLTAKYYITVKPTAILNEEGNMVTMQYKVINVNGVNLEELNLTYEEWLNETTKERRNTIKTNYRPE